MSPPHQFPMGEFAEAGEPIAAETKDVRSRALRTAAQNLLFDLVLTLILILYPLTQPDVDLASVNWSLLMFSLLKTVVATVFAAAQRYIETARAVSAG